MDMICIVLNKTIMRKLSNCCFEKKIIDWILKIPITPAQSSIVPLKKRTIKQVASVLSY